MSLNREPGSPPAGETVNPAPSPGAGIVRCPQCGSTRVRRPVRPLLLNLGACAVFVVLTPFLCVTILGVLISFLTLPVTTAIALVGGNRCRDCRYRFEPGCAGTGTAAILRFPWRLHALNIVLLFLLCIVGPHIMWAGAGGGKLPNVMADAGLFLMFGFLLWGSLAYHLVLYFSFQRKVTHPLIWAALFLLPGLLGGSLLFHNSLPRVRVGALLVMAELAPLPESATGIRFYSWSSPFSGEDFLRFTADGNDIERFLAESPALQGQEPTRYSTQKMRLKFGDEPEVNPNYPVDRTEYVSPRRSAPSWYKQEIRGPARKYHVQPPRYQLPGEVLVDDETNTIYVYLCFS